MKRIEWVDYSLNPVVMSRVSSKKEFKRSPIEKMFKIENKSSILWGGDIDIFADDIPDSWIEEIIQACLMDHKHEHIFLTRNPIRYMYLFPKRIEGIYLGALLEGAKDEDEQIDTSVDYLDFFLLEPISSVPEMILMKNISKVDGIIIGGSPNRKLAKQNSGLKWANFFTYHKLKCVFVKDCLVSHRDYQEKFSGTDSITDFRQLLWSLNTTTLDHL